MNKLFVLLTVFFYTSVAANESVTLSFSMEQNGNQLLLDSIFIKNITRSFDTTLYYPDYELVLELPSIISDYNSREFYVFPNYPNPFENETFIEVFLPKTERLKIQIFDNLGRVLFNYNETHQAGKNIFAFCPGSGQNYIVSFSNGTYEHSVKLMHAGLSSGDCRIEYHGFNSEMRLKDLKTHSFSFNPGDTFRFSGYVSACHNVEYFEIIDDVTESKEYIFDFTHISEIQPEAPEIVHMSETETSISWEWSDVSNVNKYLVNNINDVETAVDNVLNTSLYQTDLIPGTNYLLFVWAVNHCGESFPLMMHNATAAIPLNQDEIDLITSEESSVAMDLLSIFEQPDSIILRTPSTNIIIEDEHIQHLVDRMYKSVIGVGVGIAAPQVGINRRIIWVQRYDFHPSMGYWRVYYNPRITKYSEEFVKRNDGCLSVPQGGENPEVEAYSYRAKWVEVEYWDKDGIYNKEIITHDYTAHIFQHEIDHLDGIMFFDLQELEKRMDNYRIVEGECYDEILKIIRSN